MGELKRINVITIRFNSLNFVARIRSFTLSNAHFHAAMRAEDGRVGIIGHQDFVPALANQRRVELKL